MKYKIYIVALLLLFIFPSELLSQSRKKRNKSKKAATETVAKPTPKKKNGIKPYASVIKKGAITDSGVFDVHKVDENYYFEIPHDLLGKDMLLVSRFVKLPSNLGGGYVNAGSKTNQRLITWERFQNKLLIKVKSYAAVAQDSLPINISVKANNYEPTLYAFDIEAFSTDSLRSVINVTKFYNSDVKALSGLSANMRKSYKVKNLDKQRSFISSVKSFPENIEVVQDFTYNASNPPMLSSTETLSVQMNQSMILLPEDKMMPRTFDERVGWFTVSQVDYSSEKLKSDEKTFISRWRLEPKDKAAYSRGELVEPVKPIVYYLDPATPEKFRSYIKAGVEAWQKPFESAGFKNAIIAKDPPTKEEDPDFSPEDIRYSVIRYVASTTRNAMGPSVSDPRTGEIIESDIIWYHNHLRSYRNRYLLETGAANPSARTLDTPDEEIGEMMKMVIAHEVGHTLGLPHNMKASCSYDVENYRNGAFTQKNGIASTIMDYARYNYIAQPGDENIRFIRQIGPYDHYAINWGYRYLPNAKSSEDEVSALNKWIVEKGDDPKFKFGRQSSRFDPASQTEDIGNNSMKASDYGLKNLKIVAKNLPDWTSEQTDNYNDLKELYGELISVWGRYIGHVTTHVGGVHEDLRRPSEGGVVYSPVKASQQKEAIAWLHKNAFETPNWMLETTILTNTDYAGYIQKLSRYQVRYLNAMLSFDRIGRILDFQSIDNANFKAIDFFSETRKGLFVELNSGKALDSYRRALQRAYIDRMGFLLTEKMDPKRSSKYFDVSNSDIPALVRGELKTLESAIKRNYKLHKQKTDVYHYEDCLMRIDHILNPK
ncbi:MAG: zinc-dependent metalloprotease [Bacteroidetes bacterium MedPE-SWsnd-G2]|nr:MAG: zinc-dependent metalloprotease [Bacteroidetes bacterium MedPE-SWsnd-G2]